MNTGWGTGPSIAERLDYLKVCDRAVETYDRLAQAAKHNAAVCESRNLASGMKNGFHQQESEYNKLKEYYSKLKVAIALDLCKDPKFTKYSETIKAPLQLENLENNDQVLLTVAQLAAKPDEFDEFEDVIDPSFIGRKF